MSDQQNQTINMHLLNALEDDLDVQIETDLTGLNYDMRMGVALEGRYLLKITKARIKKTNDGTGVYLATSVKIIGPKACSEAGKVINFVNISIPTGTRGDDKAEGKRSLWGQFVASMISASGLLNPTNPKPIPREQVESLGVVKAMSPKQIEGSLAYGYVKVVKQTQGKRKGEDRNEVSFIMGEDFIEAPGPVDSSEQPVTTSKPASQAQPQTTAQPMAGSNGTEQPATSAPTTPAATGGADPMAFLNG